MWIHDYFEKTLHDSGYRFIAGVDEVGRGALAGPVVAAAVVFDGTGEFRDIRDSKTLSPRRREALSERILRQAAAVGFGCASESTVDRINVLRATRQAMRQAICRLPVRPDFVLVDGFWLSCLPVPCIGIIDGDALSYTIAAASIVAKVRRDAWMRSASPRYPGYGFERNVGYGTSQHLRALASLGPCRLHRKTFAGVRETLDSGGRDGQ
jgi:ribonuclease HII